MPVQRTPSVESCTQVKRFSIHRLFSRKAKFSGTFQYTEAHEVTPDGTRNGFGRTKVNENKALLTRLVELASIRKQPPENDLQAKLFNEWLCLPLEEQFADLRAHFIGLGAEKHIVVRAWMNDRSYRSIIPDGTAEPAECLFMADMDVLLRLYGTFKSDCRECLDALEGMLRALQMGFMRIGTLQQAEALYAKVSPDCRTHCLASLGPAISALQSGEFLSAWDNLSTALAMARSRYEA